MYSGRFNTNTCSSPNCGPVLTASSNLTQGQKFQNVTKTFHGGRRLKKQRGGAVDYPSQFTEPLPVDLHSSARITSLDNAFNQLPSFAGKYGMSGGKRSRRMHRMYGGMADISAPSMILTPQEEPAAFLNPQWYTENQVVPSFKGPENAYVQKAGSRKNTKKRNTKRNNKSYRKHH